MISSDALVDELKLFFSTLSFSCLSGESARDFSSFQEATRRHTVLDEIDESDSTQHFPFHESCAYKLQLKDEEDL